MAKPRKYQTAEIKARPGKFRIVMSLIVADGEVSSVDSEFDMRYLAIRDEQFVKRFLGPSWELLKDSLAQPS